MKHSWNYYRIKWSAFALTIGILGIGLFFIISTDRLPKKDAAELPRSNTELPTNNHYSNEAFSRILADNLKEFDLVEDLTFQGTEEGFFTIQGTLKDPERLIALCPALSEYEEQITPLAGAPFTLLGHLGKSEEGEGQLIADTILFPDQQLAAGEATFYIEEYTTVNALFAVPYEQILLNQEGITYQDELPTVIQIA